MAIYGLPSWTNFYCIVGTQIVAWPPGEAASRFEVHASLGGFACIGFILGFIGLGWVSVYIYIICI